MSTNQGVLLGRGISGRHQHMKSSSKDSGACGFGRDVQDALATALSWQRARHPLAFALAFALALAIAIAIAPRDLQ